MKNLLKPLTFMSLQAAILVFVAYMCLNGTQRTQDHTNRLTLDHTVPPEGSKGSIRDSIVDFGMGLLGTRYVSGSCSKDGFDCSGFVYYVFQHFKIKVPRSSIDFKNFGKEIPIDKVKKGDVLVFLSPTRNVIGHVGIVTNAKGKESDFIHASSGSEMKVIITSLKNEGYTKRFVKAVEVL